MRMQRLTPVIFVPEIEPCLSFWIDRLGYEIHAEVKDDAERYIFVLLIKDDVQVMYQTERSLQEDLPQLVGEIGAPAFFYITVDDVAAVEAALEGLPLLQERRTTFYGATEIAVREPAGNVLTFAEFARG